MPPRSVDIGFTHPISHVIGVDLGQSRDPTAIAIVETEKLVRNLKMSGGLGIRQQVESVMHRVRHLERLPLNMPYPLQVAHVRRLVMSPFLKGDDGGPPDLAIDESGVGRPVADMFEEDGLKPQRVTITAGLEEGRGAGPRSWRVPKITLVSRLQAGLHAGDLKFSPGLAEADALKRELSEFRMRHTPTGSAVFGAREGRHDDLVLAVAIGLWFAQRRAKGSRMTTEPYLGF
jgi:hypothetical protein